MKIWPLLLLLPLAGCIGDASTQDFNYSGAGTMIGYESTGHDGITDTWNAYVLGNVLWQEIEYVVLATDLGAVNFYADGLSRSDHFSGSIHFNRDCESACEYQFGMQGHQRDSGWPDEFTDGATWEFLGTTYSSHKVQLDTEVGRRMAWHVQFENEHGAYDYWMDGITGWLLRQSVRSETSYYETNIQKWQFRDVDRSVEQIVDAMYDLGERVHGDEFTALAYTGEHYMDLDDSQSMVVDAQALGSIFASITFVEYHENVPYQFYPDSPGVYPLRIFAMHEGQWREYRDYLVVQGTMTGNLDCLTLLPCMGYLESPPFGTTGATIKIDAPGPDDRLVVTADQEYEVRGAGILELNIPLEAFAGTPSMDFYPTVPRVEDIQYEVRFELDKAAMEPYWGASGPVSEADFLLRI